IMLAEVESAGGLAELLEDRRKNALVMGPGMGVGEATRDMVLTALGGPAGVVLDADALTRFEGEPGALFAAIGTREAAPAVLTRPMGGFKRLVGGFGGAKTEMAVGAARRSGGVVLLKGSDTVIAHPDGRAVINTTGTPLLATAGAGDVLAGLIGGLLAQGMDTLGAACASAYIHGRAAMAFGKRGMVAEDLPGMVPVVLDDIALY